VHGVALFLGFVLFVFLEFLFNFLFGNGCAKASDVEEHGDGEESEVDDDVEE
jgi:hypothetical protein